MKKMLRKKEEGAVMVFVALLMVVLLAFTALAIDFGTAYYQRQKLQTACDAAALAGVQYLPDTVKAESVAKDYLKENFSNDVTASVEFLDSNQKIRVTADFKSATTFGQVLGSKTIDVTTRAAAGTRTITIPGGDFPYLLYSQSEGKELHLGGKCHINGAVHSNGSVNFNAQDGQGEVSQISVAGDLDYSGGKIIIGEGADSKVYILYRWHPDWGTGQFKKVENDDGTLDVDSLPGGISNYYLLPEGPVKDENGTEVIHGYGTDYTFTPDYIAAGHTFYKGSEQVQVYPLSAYSECLKKEKFIDWDNDEPLKTIKNLKKQCEDRIETIKNGYTSATNTSLIAGYGTSSDVNYLGTSHSETTPIVIDLNGAKDVNVGNTEQKNSTIVFKGSDVQLMRLNGTKSKVHDLVFLSGSSSTNGLEYNSAVDMTMGNVYSNKDLKIFNNHSTGKVLINGNIYVDGDLTLKNVIVNGDVYATGNIDTEHVDINGFLGANGNIIYKGVPSTMISHSDSNPNALSVYSREGNVDFIAANGDPAQTVVGIVLAMKEGAKISMNGDFKFYGNVIGDQIDSTAGSEWTAYPIKQYPGYSSLDPSIIHVDEGEDKTETTFLLVE